jgi:PQQ-like domain
VDGLTHRDNGNVAPLAGSIRFPLRLLATLPADIGRGPRESEAVLAGDHVVVSRFGGVSGYSPDLESEEWRLPVDGVGSLIAIGERVFVGNGTGQVLEVDAASGATVSATTSTVPGSLGSVGPDVYIIRTPPGLTGITRDGRIRWRRQESSDVAGMSPEGQVLLFGLGREHIECVDALTGETIWQFRPGGTDLALLHDCAIVGEDVIAIFRNRGVYRIRLADGTVLGNGQPPFLGQSLIMEHAAVFAQHDKLIEYDFVAMRPAVKVEYHQKVPNRPPCGLCVGRNAIVWTSDVGYVTGVTRMPGVTPNRFWEAATHSWGFMQAAVNPFVSGSYLYVQPQGSVALACFEMPEA